MIKYNYEQLTYFTKPYGAYWFFYSSIEKVTNKAVLFKIDNEKVWLPKSIIIKKHKYKAKTGDYSVTGIKNMYTTFPRCIIENNFFTKETIIPLFTQKNIQLIRCLSIHGDRPIGHEEFNNEDNELYSACGIPVNTIIDSIY